MSKAVFQEHIEQIWNRQDASGIERFIAPTYRGFDPAEPETIVGVEGYKQHWVRLTTAFPDVRITIEDLLGEHDRVAARFVVDATHLGDFAGIPPTGRRIHIAGTASVRITNRQLVLEHGLTDALGLLKQLGVLPETVKVPVPLIF